MNLFLFGLKLPADTQYADTRKPPLTHTLGYTQHHLQAKPCHARQALAMQCQASLGRNCPSSQRGGRPGKPWHAGAAPATQQNLPGQPGPPCCLSKSVATGAYSRQETPQGYALPLPCMSAAFWIMLVSQHACFLEVPMQRHDLAVIARQPIHPSRCHLRRAARPPRAGSAARCCDHRGGHPG